MNQTMNIVKTIHGSFRAKHKLYNAMKIRFESFRFVMPKSFDIRFILKVIRKYAAEMNI